MFNDYRLKRIFKEIKLKDVAKFCGCSSSALSRFEHQDGKPISDERIELYKKYIDEH